MTWTDKIPTMTADAPAFYDDTGSETTRVDVGLTATHRQAAKIQRRRMEAPDRIRSARSALGDLPRKGETVHLVTPGGLAWETVDLVAALVDRIAPGRPLRSLSLSTFGISRYAGGQLAELIRSGRVLELDLIVAHFFRSTSGDVWTDVAGMIQTAGGRVAAVRNHAKIVAAVDARGRGFVVESSANLQRLGNVEQFATTQDRQLADFHRGWIRDLVDQAETTDRSAA